MGIAEKCSACFLFDVGCAGIPTALPKVHAWIPFSLHMLKQKIKARQMEKEKRRILLGIFDLLTERGLLTKEENRKMRVLLSAESKRL